ncbi:class I SAM-dependent methyltransferase [Sphingopyxis granuli]|uniref:class I SAM-dependent methyltransferase n=1 Tax=Sphingopyxis granuli TaxID=267128 RepID=UPI001BAF1A8A|nr:class I SAM-dependent methyltransferase [Sphingopyxis granuli]QUM72713.1 class I SAM-dependent methyltransferase [Sphingopyxis granuli]
MGVEALERIGPIMVVSRNEFDAAYQACILGKHFVEDIEYYRMAGERFWKSFRKIESLHLKPDSSVLDIGGGIMAVLLHKLLGYQAIVGDVNAIAKDDVHSAGLEFVSIDLFREDAANVQQVDLVVLQEVIEHIPQPPYIVLNRIRKMIKPGGYLFLTTPNGHRLRNLLYMVFGKEILGLYKYPEPGEALGHQHEYTLAQMRWQISNSDFRLISAEYYEDGYKGASIGARIACALAKPATLIPHWRNGLMVVGHAA